MSDIEILEVLFVPAELIEPINQLSVRTQLRCLRALDLWFTGKYTYILVSGGKFLPPSTQTAPAALLMEHWLVDHGVSEKVIVRDLQSVDTFENILFGMQALARHGHGDPSLITVTLVTEPLHAARFVHSFKAMYGSGIRVSPVRYQLSCLEHIKEALFMCIHMLDPRGKGGVARYNRLRRRKAARGE